MGGRLSALGAFREPTFPAPRFYSVGHGVPESGIASLCRGRWGCTPGDTVRKRRQDPSRVGIMEYHRRVPTTSKQPMSRYLWEYPKHQSCESLSAGKQNIYMYRAIQEQPSAFIAKKSTAQNGSLAIKKKEVWQPTCNMTVNSFYDGLVLTSRRYTLTDYPPPTSPNINQTSPLLPLPPTTPTTPTPPQHQLHPPHSSPHSNRLPTMTSEHRPSAVTVPPRV